MRTASLVIACTLAAALPAGRAEAWDVEVSSETIGQGYQLIGGRGDLISRRRLDQYLGLNVWNIGKRDAFGQPLRKNQFYFSSSRRMEFDFGDYPPPNGTIGGRDVSAELANNQFDLLFAYFGGRDVLGVIDFKLGRQIDYSLYEFLSFDGLSLTIKTPWYVAIDAYGGLLVNGALPIDSAIFRPDGTAPGVLSPHETEPKPVVGVALRAFGLRDLDATVGYRRVMSIGKNPGCLPGSTDLQTIESCAGSTSGTTEEVVAAQVRYRLLGGTLIPWAGFRYNLGVGLVDVIEAGLQYNINEKHALRAEYVYSFPTFDGDSIWNVFARQQFDDVRLGYDFRLSKVRLWARAFARFFHDVEESTDRLGLAAPIAPTNNIDGGGTLGGRVDFKRGYVRADAYAELGYGGTKIGGDLSSRMRVVREIFQLEGRLTFVHFENDARPIQYGDSFGFQVGGRLAFWRGMLLHLLFEDNISRYYASQMRVYAMLDLNAFVGGYGFAGGTPRGLGGGMGNFGSPYGMGRGF